VTVAGVRRIGKATRSPLAPFLAAVAFVAVAAVLAGWLVSQARRVQVEHRVAALEAEVTALHANGLRVAQPFAIQLHVGGRVYVVACDPAPDGGYTCTQS
jgi:hypothetical protein